MNVVLVLIPDIFLNFYLQLILTAPMNTGMTNHFIFHIHLISIDFYFNFFSASFYITFLSDGNATSIKKQIQILLLLT
jgi:hypothetical protein